MLGPEFALVRFVNDRLFSNGNGRVSILVYHHLLLTLASSQRGTAFSFVANRR